MVLSYILQEMLDGFRRAKVSSLLSAFTISFFLVLVGFFGIININIERMTNAMQTQIPLEAFVSNTIDDRQIAMLSKEMRNIAGVEKVEFISKEAGAREFQ